MITATLERTVQSGKDTAVEFENFHSIDYLQGLSVLSIVSSRGTREAHSVLVQAREQELEEMMRLSETDYKTVSFTSKENGYWDTIFFGSSEQLEYYQVIDQQLN